MFTVQLAVVFVCSQAAGRGACCSL